MTPTRYEITLRGPAGQRFLLGYSARRTRQAVLSAVLARRAAVIAHTGQQDTDWKPGGLGRFGYLYTADGAWQMGLSGRTQLQAQQEGELPRP